MGSSLVPARDIQTTLVALKDILFLTKQRANDEATVRAYMDMAQSHLETLDRAFKEDAVQSRFKSRWHRFWS